MNFTSIALAGAGFLAGAVVTIALPGVYASELLNVSANPVTVGETTVLTDLPTCQPAPASSTAAVSDPAPSSSPLVDPSSTPTPTPTPTPTATSTSSPTAEPTP